MREGNPYEERRKRSAEKRQEEENESRRKKGQEEKGSVFVLSFESREPRRSITFRSLTLCTGSRKVFPYFEREFLSWEMEKYGLDGEIRAEE